MARKPPPSTTAVPIRLRRPSFTTFVLSSLTSATGPPRRVRQLFLREAEAPLAAGEEGQRRFELGHIELRPQHLAEKQLRIGRMPQQEVTDPLLAAGADHEVDLRHIRELHVGGEATLINLGGTQGST